MKKILLIIALLTFCTTAFAGPPPPASLWRYDATNNIMVPVIEGAGVGTLPAGGGATQPITYNAITGLWEFGAGISAQSVTVSGNSAFAQIALGNNTAAHPTDSAYRVYMKDGVPFFQLGTVKFPFFGGGDMNIHATIESQMTISPQFAPLRSIGGTDLGYGLYFAADTVALPCHNAIDVKRLDSSGAWYNGKLLLLGHDVAGNVNWNDSTSSMLNVFSDGGTAGSPATPQIINSGSDDYFLNTQTRAGTNVGYSVQYPVASRTTTGFTYVDLIVKATLSRATSGGLSGIGFLFDATSIGLLSNYMFVVNVGAQDPNASYVAIADQGSTEVSCDGVSAVYRLKMVAGTASDTFTGYINGTTPTNGTISYSIADHRMADLSTIYLHLLARALSSDAATSVRIDGIYLYWE